MATAKVEVLMPPPGEPGEAPIHMSIIIKITEGRDKRDMSIELNPAVRGLAPIKNAPYNFAQKPICSAKDQLYSNTKIPIVAITI